MKNKFCDLTEDQIHALEIPAIAKGLLTSPFQHNVQGDCLLIPVDTFKNFTDCVTEYVKIHNADQSQKDHLRNILCWIYDRLSFDDIEPFENENTRAAIKNVLEGKECPALKYNPKPWAGSYQIITANATREGSAEN